MITRNIKDFKDFMECIKSGKVVRIHGGKYDISSGSMKMGVKIIIHQ